MSKILQMSLVALIAVAMIGLWLFDPFSSSPDASAGGPGGSGAGGGRAPSLVVTRPVTEALVNDRLVAVANGLARAAVTVVPLTAGVLTEVPVRSGQRVERGTLLAQLDAEEETIARDRAARALREARSDLQRLESLFASRTSTEVELNTARATFDDAGLALRDAELRLSRRSITAPIAGYVGIVPVEPGHYVTSQTTVATLDDRALMVLEFWVPQRFADTVAIGQPVGVKSFASPGRTLEGRISAVGSRVELDSRTLAVRAEVDNSDDRLRPGMSFEVSLRFPGDTFMAVDPLAIQWDSSGAFVWRIADDQAERVPVRVVQRNPESVLVDADLAVDDAIATEGLLALRPGAAVRQDKQPPS